MKFRASELPCCSSRLGCAEVRPRNRDREREVGERRGGTKEIWVRDMRARDGVAIGACLEPQNLLRGSAAFSDLSISAALRYSAARARERDESSQRSRRETREDRKGIEPRSAAQSLVSRASLLASSRAASVPRHPRRSEYRQPPAREAKEKGALRSFLPLRPSRSFAPLRELSSRLRRGTAQLAPAHAGDSERGPLPRRGGGRLRRRRSR